MIPRYRNQRRRWAARMLLVGWFGLFASVANGCGPAQGAGTRICGWLLQVLGWETQRPFLQTAAVTLLTVTGSSRPRSPPSTMPFRFNRSKTQLTATAMLFVGLLLVGMGMTNQELL